MGIVARIDRERCARLIALLQTRHGIRSEPEGFRINLCSAFHYTTAAASLCPSAHHPLEKVLTVSCRRLIGLNSSPAPRGAASERISCLKLHLTRRHSP